MQLPYAQKSGHLETMLQVIVHQSLSKLHLLKQVDDSTREFLYHCHADVGVGGAGSPNRL